jgi:hypothetical protein
VPLNIFEIAAMALHRCGYSVLPIMQGAKRPVRIEVSLLKTATARGLV